MHLRVPAGDWARSSRTTTTTGERAGTGLRGAKLFQKQTDPHGPTFSFGARPLVDCFGDPRARTHYTNSDLVEHHGAAVGRLRDEDRGHLVGGPLVEARAVRARVTTAAGPSQPRGA